MFDALQIGTVTMALSILSIPHPHSFWTPPRHLQVQIVVRSLHSSTAFIPIPILYYALSLCLPPENAVVTSEIGARFSPIQNIGGYVARGIPLRSRNL